jgi:predicted metal-dependent phosphoesterase TrpH
MTVTADLHVHTTASDGTLSPRDVVAIAKQTGLLAIAITDHDSVGGLSESNAAGKDLSLTVFPGIELSTEIDGHEIHILGFCIDHQHQGLLSLLGTLQKSRYTRAQRMVEKLVSLGYEIELDAVLQHAGGAAPGRPHVGRALVDQGYIPSVSEAFEKLLGYKMPGYVERYKLSPQEAIEAIHAAGGIAAWAHPGLADNDSLLAMFLEHGLDGLEAYHPDHNSEQSRHYVSLARNNGLFVTGGSDFHGGERARELGYCGLGKKEFQSFATACRRPLL